MFGRRATNVIVKRFCGNRDVHGHDAVAQELIVALILLKTRTSHSALSPNNTHPHIPTSPLPHAQTSPFLSCILVIPHSASSLFRVPLVLLPSSPLQQAQQQLPLNLTPSLTYHQYGDVNRRECAYQPEAQGEGHQLQAPTLRNLRGFVATQVQWLAEHVQLTLHLQHSPRAKSHP